MSVFLSNIGTILQSAVGWVGSVADTIVSTPALMVPFGIVIAGSAITLFQRLRG